MYEKTLLSEAVVWSPQNLWVRFGDEKQVNL